MNSFIFEGQIKFFNSRKFFKRRTCLLFLTIFVQIIARFFYLLQMCLLLLNCNLRNWQIWSFQPEEAAVSNVSTGCSQSLLPLSREAGPAAPASPPWSPLCGSLSMEHPALSASCSGISCFPKPLCFPVWAASLGFCSPLCYSTFCNMFFIS